VLIRLRAAWMRRLNVCEQPIPVVFDRLVQVVPGEPDSRSRAIRPHSSGSAWIRRPTRVMHRRVPSARCSATRGAGSRSLARRLVFPLLARRRSWGSCPSQFCPASSGATSLPFRTHMPFAPPHPPRLIFVGLIHVRSFGPLTDRLWQSESRVGGVRLLGFAPVCGCACGCHRRRTRSCHGLCLLQGMRTPSWRIGSGTSPDQSSAAALVRPVDAQAAPSAHGLR